MIDSKVIEDIIELYKEMEYGESTSVHLLVNDAGYDIDHDGLFDVLDALVKYAGNNGEILDYSEYDDMVVGLAYNLWFTKRLLNVGIRELQEEDRNLYFEACREEPGCEDSLQSIELQNLMWYGALSKDKFLTRAITENNKFCGYCSISAKGSTPEIGINLLYEYQGKGVAKLAISLLAQIEKSSRDIVYFIVRIDPDNNKSQKFFEKMGAVQINSEDSYIVKAIRELAEKDSSLCDTLKNATDFNDKVLRYKLII